MSIRQRLSRLERFCEARQDRAGVADANALRFHRAIMNDPLAHDLFVRIVALTPEALHTRDSDFYKAAAERPGLAGAVAELSRRLGLL
ncbi:MAG TPA: hypothetical protein PL072_10435 [Phycisphaerales bacterium]|nr:hypothetical protein [Phycisphaerales bacterium]